MTLTIVKNATCTFCGCVCDDIELHANGEKIVETKTKYEKGDKVKVKDGTFSGMEGEIKEVLEGKGAVRVELTIFGRQVPVDLEYWQVDYV